MHELLSLLLQKGIVLSHAEPCVRFYYSLSFNSKVTSVKALSDPHPAELLAVPSALALNLGSVFLTMTGALHRSGGGGGGGGDRLLTGLGAPLRKNVLIFVLTVTHILLIHHNMYL